MARYGLYIIIIALWVTALTMPALATSMDGIDYGNANVYGFPMSFGLPGSGYGVEGSGINYNYPGLSIPEETKVRYGYFSGDYTPQYSVPQNYNTFGGDATGYFGNAANGMSVSFGSPSMSHDASNTVFMKDLAYEADVDNSFIAFPGFGSGSLGLSFPTISSNKTSIKYAESIKFSVTTESDRMTFPSFSMPLGLGLGYSNAQIAGTNPFNSGIFFTAT